MKSDLESSNHKRVTQSTIKIIQEPSFSECVNTLSCSLPGLDPNDNDNRLKLIAMWQTCISAQLATPSKHHFKQTFYENSQEFPSFPTTLH